MCSIQKTKPSLPVTEEEREKALQMMELMQNSFRPQNIFWELSTHKDQNNFFQIALDSFKNGFKQLIIQRITLLMSYKYETQLLNHRDRAIQRLSLKNQAIERNFFDKNCSTQCYKNGFGRSLILVILLMSAIFLILSLGSLVYVILQDQQYLFSHVHTHFILSTIKKVDTLKLILVRQAVYEIVGNQIVKVFRYKHAQLPNNEDQYNFMTGVILGLLMVFVISLVPFVLVKDIRCSVNKQYEFQEKMMKYGGRFKFVQPKSCIHYWSIWNRQQDYRHRGY